ncbi:MAG: hypothetical protein JWQ62_577 [Lacunisphaera sp.]|nr:hypothetical protein [Lacunisphaera sp.]
MDCGIPGMDDHEARAPECGARGFSEVRSGQGHDGHEFVGAVSRVRGASRWAKRSFAEASAFARRYGGQVGRQFSFGSRKKKWRRGRDSNPRDLAAHLISSQARSTTLPPLRDNLPSPRLRRVWAAERRVLPRKRKQKLRFTARRGPVWRPPTGFLVESPPQMGLSPNFREWAAWRMVHAAHQCLFPPHPSPPPSASESVSICSYSRGVRPATAPRASTSAPLLRPKWVRHPSRPMMSMRCPWRRCRPRCAPR